MSLQPVESFMPLLSHVCLSRYAIRRMTKPRELVNVRNG
jgi:hypothetical protein